MISSSRDFDGKHISAENQFQSAFQHLVSSVNVYRSKERLPLPPSASKPVAMGIFKLRNLLSNQILTSLPDCDLADLLMHLKPVSLIGGEELYKPSEKIKFVYFPETTVVSHLHVLADGNTGETALIGKNGVVGLSAILGSPIPSNWTQVTISGYAMQIRADILKEKFMKSETLLASLLEVTNDYINQVAQRVICSMYHVGEQRLCSWLLMLLDNTDKVWLPLTQDQLSKHLGLHRPSVTLIAQTLRKKGLIEYRRGQFRILDRQGLADSACECYSASAQTQTISNVIQ